MAATDTAARRRFDPPFVLCFVGAMAVGFDIQSTGVAAPAMGPALGLTRAQLGPVFSASVVGLLIGAVLLGRVADRIGRKRTLMLSLTVFGVFSLATAAAWNFNSLLLIRLVAGLGLGGAMPNLIALSAEAFPSPRRARKVTEMTAGMSFGAGIAGAIAFGLNWKAIFLVGGIAPLLLAALMIAALPESSRFVEARDQETEKAAGRLSFPQILFGGGRAATTLLLWTATFGSLLCLYLLLNWLPTLMADKGISKPTASLISLLFNLGGTGGVLTLAALVDRPRRGAVVAVWYLCLAASIAGLAVAGASLGQSGAAGFVVGVFVSSAPLMLYGLAPTFYEVVVRGAGTGAMVAFGRIGAIIGPLLAAALLGAGFGAAGVLLALLPLVVIAGAATLALLRRPTVAD
jgi:AAHS family 3-hydroxyphenylpropionic acid transporter